MEKGLQDCQKIVTVCTITKQTFFSGDISLPGERVFHALKFNNDRKIKAVNLSVGDMIKSRYSKFGNGKIYLNTCLVGKDLKI